MSAITTDIFIEKSNAAHDNFYDYTETEYVSSKKKVTIICPKHGKFEQAAGDHMHGSGCRKCANEKQGASKTSTREKFIEKAITVHGDKYDYTDVVYVNLQTPVNIICIEHGLFKQRPNNHLTGYECKKCGAIKHAANKKKRSGENFVKNAAIIHNNEYNYSKVVYEDEHTKVIIICNIHGEYEQYPYIHLAKKGCPKCGKMRQIKANTSTTKGFIEKAIAIHEDIYDYTEVVYVNSQTYVNIVCKKHGLFKQTPQSHLNGTGCRRCGDERRALTLNDFIKNAINVHGDEYDYSKVDYVNIITNIILVCKTHGEFTQNPRNHLRGSKCPKCNLCPSCQLWKTMNGKLCEYCDPAKSIKLYQKTKEYAVVKFLKENLPDNEFIHNKSIGTDCTEGHLFPDILFDCMHYRLIVEVDEHKHRGANYQCDEKRMYDIIAKLGMPCIFIRYNPDSKQSNKNALLEKVKDYLDLDIDDEEKVWDNFGFKADYLFY